MSKRLLRYSACGLFVGMLGLASGATLFSDNFDSGSLNPAKWANSAPSSNTIVDLGGGDFCLQLKPTGSWGEHVYSVPSFSRGNNLTCTFRVWRSTLNAQYGFHGPFHNNNTGAVYSNHEGGVDYVINDLRLGEGIPPNGIQGGFSLTALTTAVQNANSKAVSVLVKVTLGNTQGCRIEFSTDDGANYNTLIDTNVTPDGGRALGTAASGIYIGFGGFAGQAGETRIDDIYVTDSTPPAAAVSDWALYN